MCSWGIGSSEGVRVVQDSGARLRARPSAIWGVTSLHMYHFVVEIHSTSQDQLHLPPSTHALAESTESLEENRLLTRKWTLLEEDERSLCLVDETHVFESKN